MTLSKLPISLLIEIIARARCAPTPARTARADRASQEIVRRAAASAASCGVLRRYWG
jgi:hypothetical protein